MTYPVLVEPTPGRGYVATAIGMPECAYSAATEDEAVIGVRNALVTRLSGAKLVQVDLPGDDDPWVKWAGRFAADETWDDFQALMAADRQSLDRDFDDD